MERQLLRPKMGGRYVRQNLGCPVYTRLGGGLVLYWLFNAYDSSNQDTFANEHSDSTDQDTFANEHCDAAKTSSDQDTFANEHSDSARTGHHNRVCFTHSA